MNRGNKLGVLIVVAIVCIGGGGGLEILLRNIWGFGTMPLYASSDKWEYMPVPNQVGKRLGNKYCYNSLGMRSDEVDARKKHILGLGDSVLHGGVQTDQDSLATSLFTKEMGVQMLNVSAGSWGPDNCAAYLKSNGLFDAVGVFLLVSSHDAYDNMDFSPIVGLHPSYPDRQYSCAISEVFFRYLIPRIKLWFNKNNGDLDPDQKVLAGVGIHKEGRIFNPGFDQIKYMCETAKIPLVVCLHADHAELAQHKYNEQGDLIIDWCKANHVRLVKELDEGFTTEDYRDGIHINTKGQRKLADIMEREFKGYGK